MIQTHENQALQETEPYLTSFKRFADNGAAKNPPWVRSIRQSGISHFAERGFPSTRHEEWKHTPVSPIVKLPFKPAFSCSLDGLTSEEIQRFTFEGMKCNLLVFLNGHYSPELSSLIPQSAGVRMGGLAAAISTDAVTVEQHLAHYARCDDNAFVALNTAFFSDGAFLLIPQGKVIEEPIHLLFIASARETESSIHPRNLIIAQPNSQATIIESYVSRADTAYSTNAVTEIAVGDSAVIEHCKIQSESLAGFHIATIQAHLDRASSVISHSISLGARWARNNINLVLDAEGIDCILNGLYLANGKQLVDHHTVVDHQKPHCSSHEFYHGILDGRSKGVFNGKIFVRKDAQKTDAKQTNKNLLLSDEAMIDTKPQLEIFADDVKCTHGATVGQLDEEAIFYLQSRGIGYSEARQMLTLAFASDIIHRIKIEAVREQLNQFLVRQLAQKIQTSEKGTA